MTKDNGQPKRVPGSRPELAGRHACRLCRHDQYLHNNLQGCPFCTCMATAGEAGARTDRELGFTILAPGECLSMYEPRRPEPPQPRFETWTEYGLRIDCAKHGCDPACPEDGEVLPRREHQTRTIERVNGHAVTAVESQVTRGPWRPR